MTPLAKLLEAAREWRSDRGHEVDVLRAAADPALDAAVREMREALPAVVDAAGWYWGERCPDCGESITGNCADHGRQLAILARIHDALKMAKEGE